MPIWRLDCWGRMTFMLMHMPSTSEKKPTCKNAMVMPPRSVVCAGAPCRAAPRAVPFIVAQGAQCAKRKMDAPPGMCYNRDDACKWRDGMTAIRLGALLALLLGPGALLAARRGIR